MSATPDADDGDRPDRLIYLHGFTQTHHHWHHVARLVADRLPGDPTTAFVDLPGHGLAGADARGDIDTSGERLARLAGPGTYVGYSMGGRMALVAALARPDMVQRLVLIGATPGIADADDRLARRRLDDERADRIERIGVEEFLTEWMSAPLFATLPPERWGLEHRHRNTAAGLARSLRRYGTGVQEPLWDRLPDLDVPVLVLAGALDRKFCDIGRAMADALPRATFTEIPATGHATHTEDPDAVAHRLAEWIGSSPIASN